MKRHFKTVGFALPALLVACGSILGGTDVPPVGDAGVDGSTTRHDAGSGSGSGSSASMGGHSSSGSSGSSSSTDSGVMRDSGSSADGALPGDGAVPEGGGADQFVPCSVTACAATLAAANPTPASCAIASCSPLTNACVYDAVDADGDGHRTSTCSAAGLTIATGDDCNDADPSVYPGAWDGPAQTADAGMVEASSCNMVDNDCNGKVDDGILADGSSCVCTVNTTKACTGGAANCPGTSTCLGGPGTPAFYGPCVAPSACQCGPDSPDGLSTQSCGTCGKATQTCTAGGTWGACTGDAPATAACGVTSPACAAGTSSCGGPCVGGTPTYGQACGSCGGTIACGGGCSVSTPTNLNAACGSCGGKIECNGSCSVATPGNLNASCNSCGGVYECNGSCSVTPPGDYGLSCNTCGAKYDCSGACSGAAPAGWSQTFDTTLAMDFNSNHCAANQVAYTWVPSFGAPTNPSGTYTCTYQFTGENNLGSSNTQNVIYVGCSSNPTAGNGYSEPTLAKGTITATITCPVGQNVVAYPVVCNESGGCCNDPSVNLELINCTSTNAICK